MAVECNPVNDGKTRDCFQPMQVQKSARYELTVSPHKLPSRAYKEMPQSRLGIQERVQNLRDLVDKPNGSIGKSAQSARAPI